MELPVVVSSGHRDAGQTPGCCESAHAVSDSGPAATIGSPTWSVLRNLSELHVAITSTCNLHCSYCYAEVERPGRGFPLFSLELFRRLMDIVATFSRKTHIVISFHGGEPLLEAPGWYDEACTIAKRVLGDAGKRCRFILQSNLTLLRDEHVSVFVRHGVMIGTSLDGPEEIHDSVRGHFQATIRNLHRLREAGVFSGAIAVIHHHNWDLVPQVFEAYCALGIHSFHFNIASTVGHGGGLLALSEDQIYRVFCDDFDCMRHYGGTMIETRLLANLKRHVKPPTTQEFLADLRCDNPFCHAGINMVVVTHTGEIYPCGCAGTSGNMKNFYLGNILNSGCDLVLYQQQLRRFHEKSPKYELECRCCPARFVCEHGCPAYDANDPITPEHQCAATKRFEKYLSSLGREIVEHVASFGTSADEGPVWS
jgi:uncharacterized protein